MSITLHFQDIEEILFSSADQTYLTDKAGTQELSFVYNHSFLKGQYHEIVLQDFKISYGNSHLKDCTTILFESCTEIVEMHFTLNGSSSTYINGFDKNFGISNNSHNIFYGNDVKGKMKLNTSDMFIFEIKFNPIFFLKYLPETPIFNKFKRKIETQELGILSEHNRTITPQMFTIIKQITHCSFKDEFRKLFLEAKVLELLLLQLEQIESCSFCLEEKNIIKEKNNIEKMYLVKDIIDENLFKKLTLSELSNGIQSNECTLKKTFKDTFNTTVFAYIKEQRMLKAKQILLNGVTTINEVADIIGYKNPQHFTVAFKRHFGYVPSKLLK